MSYINGSVSGFRGIGQGTLPNTISITGPGGISGEAVIMDNVATGNQFPSAPQTEGVWYGAGTKGAITTTPTSASIGNYARAPGSAAVAVGGGVNSLYGANAGADSAIAIGGSSNASVGAARAVDLRAIAIGSGHGAFQGARASAVDGIAIGSRSVVETGSTAGIAIGLTATVEGGENIAIGDGSYSFTEGVAVGYSAGANDINGTAVGANAKANCPNATAIGYGAVANTWVLNTSCPLAISAASTIIGGGAPGGITNRLRIRINGVNYTIPLCADV